MCGMFEIKEGAGVGWGEELSVPESEGQNFERSFCLRMQVHHSKEAWPLECRTKQTRRNIDFNVLNCGNHIL